MAVRNFASLLPPFPPTIPILLNSGAKLGPYEVVSTLGAGGMGEVYRARDARLSRDVAVKVLPAAFSRDPERLRRFEQEARATAALNHPNILAIFDIGNHEESLYVVSELLEGETLRQRIQGGPVPPRKATDYALQIARGLAAAHDQGITHRDLKPENVFLTKDGRIKILDFGLAKLSQPEKGSSGADTPTVALQTEPGLVLGTVGYMSPEQVRGKPADPRSDIFSLGAILYEMVSGKRAFQGDTAADTMSAILKAEPPPLTDTQPNIPPGLARIAEHCLEKDAANRFQSARDVAFALEAFSGSSSTATAMPRISASPKRRTLSVLTAVGAIILAAVIAFVAARMTAPAAAQPAFHQLTFPRGYIQTARFAPDGETIIYSAAWGGKPIELFSTRPQGSESRALGLSDTDLLGISSSGELAVRLTPRFTGAYSIIGTLARTMLSGGTPRPVENDIEFADWTPDGKDMAIVRRVAGRTRLEFPLGKVLYETVGWIGNPRFSPRGDSIAFIDHISIVGDPGTVAIVDLAGHKKTLTQQFDSVQGLAWSPTSDEIWFTATPSGGARALRAVSPSGKERLIVRIPGMLNLFDISRTGRVLLSSDDWRVGIIALAPGSTKEQDLSWMDFSAIRDFSSDGKLLLFDEAGEAGGLSGAIYLRKMDGSAPVRLADGDSNSLSADSKWVLAGTGFNLHSVLTLPTGTGQGQTLNIGTLDYHWGNFLPNGRQILFAGNEPGQGSRMFVMDLAQGPSHPITPEGVGVVSYSHFVSPDGQSFLGVDSDRNSEVYSAKSGKGKLVPGLNPAEIAFGWTGDSKSVYVYRPAVPALVYRVELSTGHRELWKELNPPDPVGINFIRAPHISADGKAYAYNYNRVWSELFLVDDLK
jgi:serine/threonine protein kinase/Tol biopolymer transport system component